MLRGTIRQGPTGTLGNQTGKEEKEKARTTAKAKMAKPMGKVTIRPSLRGIAQTLLATHRTTTPTLGSAASAGPSVLPWKRQAQWAMGKAHRAATRYYRARME